jgi:all-trans-8'-apo-beta-carotenal 15,15'-oxygenase
MEALMKHLNFKRNIPVATVFGALGADVDDRPQDEIAVTGKLPERLTGVLFRNGPGKFRRGGRTKRTVLDGDGVVQRLELAEGRARYGRRFVRTPKFQTEEAADRFLSPTWTTTAPGLLTNIGQHLQSQAGVTVYEVNGKLYALDEGGAPGFELDRKTLQTLRPVSLGLPEQDAAPKAHARYLAESGDWLFASTRTGSKGMMIDIVRHCPDGTRVVTPTVSAPRMGYVHDFAATTRYAIVILQAVHIHALRYLSGLASFAECLEWRPAQGNRVLLIDLRTGSCQVFDAAAAWVWHLANAYEQGGEVMVDFVGYDNPGHFLGRDAQLAAVMRGQQGVHGAPGTLRRHVITPASGRLTETVLSDGNYEFPSVDGRGAGRRHECVYVTCGFQSGALHSGVAAINTRTGRRDAYDFGPCMNAGEPVFAADPAGMPGAGWIITQTLDADRGTSGFALLDARNVAAGPIAAVELGETMPMSFHGHWVAA